MNSISFRLPFVSHPNVRRLPALLLAAALLSTSACDSESPLGSPFRDANTAPAGSLPGSGYDLSVVFVTEHSARLSFTEVDDGRGAPANYVMHFLPAAMKDWAAAQTVEKGSCAGSIAGRVVGEKRECTLDGLQSGAGYDIRVVAVRQEEGGEVVAGPPSNIVSATTLGASSQLSSHEPGGYSRITSRSFHSRVEDGWGDTGSGGFSIVSDKSAPHACCSVGQAKYRAGLEGGSGPVRIWKNFAERRNTEIYISYWVKFSENWQGHTSGVNKIIFAWIHDDPSVVVSATGSGSGSLRPQLRLQNIPGGTANYSANVNDIRIERGKWHHWEIQLISNSGGHDNGVGRVWIDGVLALDHRDINYAGATEARSWQGVYWNPTWGGVGDRVKQDMFMWMDHFHVSGR